MNEDKCYKVLILGDSSVGKTCLLERYTEGKYVRGQLTVGPDIKIKTVEVDGRVMKLYIWDTAGQEQFRAITRSYYKDAMGVLLLYDVTHSKTFSSLEWWLVDIKKRAPNIPLIIVGNKCDSIEREISYEKGHQFAQARNIKFFETSARQNVKIDDVFKTLAQDMAGNTTQSDNTIRESMVSLERSLSAASSRATEGKKSSRCSC